MKPEWTLVEGRKLARMLERELAPLGWHVGLTGSVLMKGSSCKDIDLLVYPHKTFDRVMVRVFKKLKSLGWTRRKTTAMMWSYWRKKGSPDSKFVEVYETKDGRRVDLIYVW